MSAKLRASVNPNGRQTTVAFYLDGVSKGSVEAGNGVLPVTVELLASGLIPQTLYSVTSSALSSEGYNESAFPVQLLTTEFGGVTINPSPGKFELTVYESAAIPKPAGKLAVSTIGRRGAFSGSLQLDGVSYRLRGELDSAGFTLIETGHGRVKNGASNGAAFISLVLSEDEEGAMRLRMKMAFKNSTKSHLWAEGAELARPSPGVAPGRYTIILPTRDAAQPGTSQGDGYLAGRISASGRARFAGRAGDGTAFSAGGRPLSDNVVSIAKMIGRRTPGFISGELRFSIGDNGAVGGDLLWRSGYSRRIVPAGGRYIKLGRADYILPHASGRDNSSNGGTSPGRIKLRVDRATGVFGGSIPLPGSKAPPRFNGVIVQPLNPGRGEADFNGVFGAVELSAQ